MKKGLQRELRHFSLFRNDNALFQKSIDKAKSEKKIQKMTVEFLGIEAKKTVESLTINRGISHSIRGISHNSVDTRRLQE